MLHGDPVDSAPSANRKAEPSSRRGKRGKKGGRPDEVQVAKVPVHAAGAHPMFKAMAAATGHEEDDEDQDDTTPEASEAAGETVGDGSAKNTCRNGAGSISLIPACLRAACRC